MFDFQKSTTAALAFLAQRIGQATSTTTIIETEVAALSPPLPTVARTLFVDPFNGSDSNTTVGGGRQNAPLQTLGEAMARIGNPINNLDWATPWRIVLQGIGSFNHGAVAIPTRRLIIEVPAGSELIWDAIYTLDNTFRFTSSYGALLAIVATPSPSIIPGLSDLFPLTMPGVLARVSNVGFDADSIRVISTGAPFAAAVELSFTGLFLGKVAIDPLSFAPGQVVTSFERCSVGHYGQDAVDPHNGEVRGFRGSILRAGRLMKQQRFTDVFDSVIAGDVDVSSLSSWRNTQTIAPGWSFTGPVGSLGLDYATNFYVGGTVPAATKVLEENQVP